ncbi:MAG: hypothetical protein GX096_12525 [Clostridiales bacterium]|nr:hypothetical protein [Clostridiales bacterium]
MSGRTSPFEALTGLEKQLKWLEYQTITLPYVSSQLDDMEEETQVASASLAHTKAEHLVQKSKELLNQVTKPQPTQVTSENEQQAKAAQKQPLPSGTSQGDFQRTRHTQYDAVIARMKQAEKKTSGFYNISS